MYILWAQPPLAVVTTTFGVFRSSGLHLGCASTAFPIQKSAGQWLEESW
jgi:hypothetical protein